MVTLELELNVNGVTEARAGHGNRDTATTRETADTQLEEFREGQLGDVNEESGCDKKDEDVPEEGIPAETAH